MGHFDESGLEAAAGRLTADGIDVIRLTYCDLIGSERGRDLLVQHFPRTVGDGVAFCRSVYGTTPMGDVVDIEGGLSEGLPDIVAFPDLETFRTVPWEPGVATVIADLFNPDGSPSEESPRAVLRRIVDKFADLGMRPFVGPELEFYLLDEDATAPNGWQLASPHGPGSRWRTRDCTTRSDVHELRRNPPIVRSLNSSPTCRTSFGHR